MGFLGGILTTVAPVATQYIVSGAEVDVAQANSAATAAALAANGQLSASSARRSELIILGVLGVIGLGVYMVNRG